MNGKRPGGKPAGALRICDDPVAIVKCKREPSLSSEYLELSLRGRVASSIGRWVAARAHEMRRLMVQPQRLHGSDHGATATTRNQQRLLTHLARKGPRERVTKKLENAVAVSGQQRGAQTVQKRQHRYSVVFGVIYTL
jgi:hypothetical protein